MSHYARWYWENKDIIEKMKIEKKVIFTNFSEIQEITSFDSSSNDKYKPLEGNTFVFEYSGYITLIV